MTATITISYGRILADIPYANGQGPKQAKQISGARAEWDKTVTPNKFIGWSYPLTIGTCHSFRRVFGRDLQITNVLADWARQEIAKAEQLDELREGAMSQAIRLERLSAEAPQLYLAMQAREYQPVGSAFLVTAGQAILGDEPGLGKTLQSLGAIIESGAETILVSCPRTATYSVWLSETLRWAPSIEPFICQGFRRQREEEFGEFLDYSGKKMLIINTEMMRMIPQRCPFGPLNKCPTKGETQTHKHEHDIAAWPFLFGVKWDAIVIDESQDSLASTKNTMSKSITQVRYGAMHIRRNLKPGGLAIASSGTPFRSYLDRSWGTLNWLQPKVFTSFWRFAEEHFGVTSNGWGKVVGRIDESTGQRVVEPLDQAAFDQALRPYYLRRTKAEVAKDLPPVMYAGTPPDNDPQGPCYVRLDMDDKQYKAYHNMVLDAEAQIEGGRITATGTLAEITRLRQFATSYGRVGEGRTMLPDLPSNKIEWIIEFMKEREHGDGKVVIASSFTEVIELTAASLRKEGWEVLTLTGAASDKKRKALIERFQDPDDPLWIVAINSKAGGTAITLDRADDMIVMDMPWTSDEFEQLQDRIHRVSRIHQVMIHRLLSIGTIEEWIAGLSEQERKTIEKAQPKRLAELVLEALSR